MQSVAASKADLPIGIIPSTGSLENLEQLLDDTSLVNLAFTQADTAQYYLNRRPGQ